MDAQKVFYSGCHEGNTKIVLQAFTRPNAAFKANTTAPLESFAMKH
jgi:hypothetical protein